VLFSLQKNYAILNKEKCSRLTRTRRKLAVCVVCLQQENFNKKLKKKTKQSEKILLAFYSV